MNIRSATFVKGVVQNDELLDDATTPHVAFIGRSNVGKSSVINALTQQKGLARTSSFPGRTQEVNLYLINKSLYLVDLPGYGYAKASWEARERLQKMINWYLFDSRYQQRKVVLIIDANVGVTEIDLEMLHGLEEYNKTIVVVANKIDKIRPSQYKHQLEVIQAQMGNHLVIPFSAKKNTGVSYLVNEILKA